MRHRKRTISKLGRDTAHREAMLANMVVSLIEHKRIKTTISKAKASRRIAEKMVTLGKRGDVHSRRLAVAKLHNPTAVTELFKVVAPAFADRQGGYTRIVRLGRRSSDSSEMAILEWVDYTPPVVEETADA
jgi:large subunit ribosomal protein L17